MERRRGCDSPRPGAPVAHCRVYLALLPSGPDAVRRLKSHRVRAAMRLTKTSVYQAGRQIVVEPRRREQLIDGNVLFVGVGDVDRAGTDEKRRAPPRQLRD